MSDHHSHEVDESGEIPPISVGARRWKILIAWIFLLAIVVFLVLFIASYSDSDEPLRSIFGVLPAPPFGSVTA